MLREGKKQKQHDSTKKSIADLPPRILADTIAENYKIKQNNKDNTRLSASSIKTVWVKAMMIYRQDHPGPAVGSPNNKDIAILKKAIERIDWGFTPWSEVITNIVVRWVDYLTRFSWRAYNHMPEIPDIQFIAYNLKYFVKYHQEPAVSSDRAIRKAEEMVEKARNEKSNADTRGLHKTSQLVAKNYQIEIDRLTEAVSRYNSDLTLLIEELKETKEVNRRLINWAKSKGYDVEEDILDAIFGDYELPGKLK